MTNKDVFLQVLAEASGKPISEMQHFAATGLPMLGETGKMGVELSDEDAAKLLVKLRDQIPSIKRWLDEGGMKEILDRFAAKSPPQ